jgi:hypothetical protein
MARYAIRELLAIGRCPQVDAQIRVNALAVVTECCGEDATPPTATRAVGFVVAGGEE